MHTNIEVLVPEAAFSPITITSLAQLQELAANPPEPEFQHITITMTTKVAVANVLGALLAYGTANVYAENGLKAVGLGDYYSGNVRGAARAIAKQIADEAGFVPTADFTAYLATVNFKGAKKSQAGAKVRGTSEDLAPGRGPTHFEPKFEGVTVTSAPAPAPVGISQVW